jgi:hypothetical protein
MPNPLAIQASKLHLTPMGTSVIENEPVPLADAVEASKKGKPVWAPWRAKDWYIRIYTSNPRYVYQVYPNHIQAYRDAGGVEPQE